MSLNFAAVVRDVELRDEMIQHTITKDYADVLLIVTGGTLCMINTDHGYVSAPGLADRLKQMQIFYDREHAEKVGLDSDWLVTPQTPFKKRIRFRVLEYETLIDSSNIEVSDQIKIA